MCARRLIQARMGTVCLPAATPIRGGSRLPQRRTPSAPTPWRCRAGCSALQPPTLLEGWFQAARRHSADRSLESETGNLVSSRLNSRSTFSARLL